MKEWFYVKNDLKAREDIKDIIMRPIWQRFGLRKPKVEIDEAAEECRKAFGIVCSFIGTRDLVQEHIAFRVWPLVEKWEMPKETISKSDEGGLVSVGTMLRRRRSCRRKHLRQNLFIRDTKVIAHEASVL
jgi:hypothetical protein